MPNFSHTQRVSYVLLSWMCFSVAIHRGRVKGTPGPHSLRGCPLCWNAGQSSLENGTRHVAVCTWTCSWDGIGPRGTRSLYDLALPLTALMSRALGSVLTPFTESHETPSLPCVLSWWEWRESKVQTSPSSEQKQPFRAARVKPSFNPSRDPNRWGQGRSVWVRVGHTSPGPHLLSNGLLSRSVGTRWSHHPAGVTQNSVGDLGLPSPFPESSGGHQVEHTC